MTASTATPLQYVMPYVHLSIAILAEVIATSFMKYTNGFTKLGPSLVVVAGYGCAFYFLSLAIRTVPTGVAYAIWSGAGVVLIVAIAWLFQGQKLDFGALCGMALIVAGVIMINLFSNSVPH